MSPFLQRIVTAFGGLDGFEVGLVTALPYLVGAGGMTFRSRSSDRTGERKWQTVIPVMCIVVGLPSASAISDPTLKMACLCVAGFGSFAVYASF